MIRSVTFPRKFLTVVTGLNKLFSKGSFIYTYYVGLVISLSDVISIKKSYFLKLPLPLVATSTYCFLKCTNHHLKLGQLGREKVPKIDPIIGEESS